jgi:hypothetical protein
MADRKTHDLVPLELAARTVYQRVYEETHRKAGMACTPEQLNGIAYAIAALLPVFTNEDDPQSFRRLSEEELLKGLFRDGGRAMIFIDGRASIRALAVSAKGLDRVARVLSAAQK